MITLQEVINMHLKNAMLTSNTDVKSVLRVLIGEFNRIGKKVTDEQVVSIVKKMVENAKIIGGNEREIEILSTYLPKQLTEDQLSAIITALIFNNNYTVKDMGAIMGVLKQSYSGQYDGKLASSIIKSKLL